MALASDHTHWALNLLETFEISRTLQLYIYMYLADELQKLTSKF